MQQDNCPKQLFASNGYTTKLSVNYSLLLFKFFFLHLKIGALPPKVRLTHLYVNIRKLKLKLDLNRIDHLIFIY